MTRSRTALLIALKVTISATLLFLVVRRLGPGGIAAQLRQVEVAVVVFALIPQLLGVLAMAVRWHRLALGLLTFFQTVRFTFIGIFYGAVLPGAISGDVAKGAAVAWQDRSTRTAVLPASILADRLIGFYTLGVFFCAACAFMLWRPPGGSALLAQLGGTGLLLSVPFVILVPLSLTNRGRGLLGSLIRGVLRSTRIRSIAERLLAVLDTYRSRRDVLTSAVLLSVLVHASSVVVYLIVFDALHLAVPMFLIVVLYAVLSVLVMIPISISGLGVREWFTLAFFPAIGLAAETGVAFSLTLLAIGWVAAAIGGLWHLLDVVPATRGSRPQDGLSS